LTYLIQNKKTREYFQDGRWTLDSGWADQYSDIAKAMIACLRNDLHDVDLVLRFGLEGGRKYSLQLSLPEPLGCASVAIASATLNPTLLQPVRS